MSLWAFLAVAKNARRKCVEFTPHALNVRYFGGSRNSERVLLCMDKAGLSLPMQNTGLWAFLAVAKNARTKMPRTEHPKPESGFMRVEQQSRFCRVAVRPRCIMFWLRQNIMHQS
jgi:hypothetical protein